MLVILRIERGIYMDSGDIKLLMLQYFSIIYGTKFIYIGKWELTLQITSKCIKHLYDSNAWYIHMCV